jgi:hypothetical protein
MEKYITGFMSFLILLSFSCQSEKQPETVKNEIQTDTATQSIMKLENNKAVLLVDLNGGMLHDFHLRDMGLNPLNWKINASHLPGFKGHFVCFDRWGPPSEGEKANGFIHHGEVSTIKWQVLAEPQKSNGMLTTSMTCTLPMGGLQLTRKIEMPENDPVFHVTEEIKSLNKYGRMYNLVQHVTVGPPFLDTSTIFNNNTEKGFVNKGDGSLNQDQTVIRWPEATHEGKKVSLVNFRDPWPGLSSFIFSQDLKFGWVTATNPDKNLMLGYIFKVKDYPWINFWRSMDNGKHEAFGMEFGTTGLHEPFPVIARQGKLLGRNIYDFIDAGEIKTKSYTAFLARVTAGYNGVENVEIVDSMLIITEKDNPGGEIRYNLRR